MDNYYLTKTRYPFLNQEVQGIIRMDRAIIYLRQLFERLMNNVVERKTKTLGESYYNVQSYLAEIKRICTLSGDRSLLEETFGMLGHLSTRTNRLEAINALSNYSIFLTQFKPNEYYDEYDLDDSRFTAKSKAEGGSEEQKSNIDTSEKSSVFIIMPFSPQFNDVWKGGIQRACEKMGFKPIRVDMINRSTNITDDIVNSIEKCHLAIVDVTENNPNVMFELGYTLAKNKPNIIISQSANYLPFDIRNIRTIVYSNTWSGVEDLNINLQKFLKEYIPKKKTQ